MSTYHIPVLLQPACALLQVRPGAKYIDATYGGGGHSKEIIRLGGRVLAIDRDPDAFKGVTATSQLIPAPGNFSEIDKLAEKYEWAPVAGVIFDFGVSLHQIITPSRGFSFQTSGPLDMRMDPSSPYTAADLVNTLAPPQLENIFSDYGEVKNSRQIVSRLIAARPIQSTLQLNSLIGNRDLSRKIFQALRIAVNDELSAIKTALPKAFSILEPTGRLSAISFHSLEDRIVKQQFSAWTAEHLGEIITKKPILPNYEEISSNPASHSAKLRVFQKNI